MRCYSWAWLCWQARTRLPNPRNHPPWSSWWKLVEDVAPEFLPLLGNDGGLDATKISRDFREIHSGVCSIRVTPHQRYSSRIPGWNYTIVEKPKEGQYRYIRFAWKRVGGEGIMIQLHNTQGSWNQRYLAGKAGASPRSIRSVASR